VAGCGVAEAVAAGAEQVIVVSATPESASLPPRRRGPKALADAVYATLERQAVDPEIAEVDRINRLVETLGHRTEDGGRAWLLQLRRGMKWSDGKPFTADDFVFWFEDIYRNKDLIPTPSAAMAINGLAALLAMLPAAWPLARRGRG